MALPPRTLTYLHCCSQALLDQKVPLEMLETKVGHDTNFTT